MLAIRGMISSTQNGSAMITWAISTAAEAERHVQEAALEQDQQRDAEHDGGHHERQQQQRGDAATGTTPCGGRAGS